MIGAGRDHRDVADLGAVALYFGIRFFEYLFLDSSVGARVSPPVREEGSVMFAHTVEQPYMLPWSWGWVAPSPD